MSERRTTPARSIGSMSGMDRLPVKTWSFRDGGGTGQLLRVEDYGPGNVWVQSLDSPTGMGWWTDRADVPQPPLPDPTAETSRHA